MASILILGDGMWAAGSYGSPLGSRSLAIRCALSSSIPPEDFHIIGLELTVDRHDWNTFDHGLADDQAIKRILVVVREFGYMKRMDVLNRKRRNRISRQPLWDKGLRRLGQSKFTQ